MFKRKKKLIVIIFFIFFFSFACNNKNSIKNYNSYVYKNIGLDATFLNNNSQTKLTENQKLFSLAKVWGFLKYYHPTASNKNMNWDHELFIKIKQLDTVTSVRSLNNLYINWINSLGQLPKRKTKAASFENSYFENIRFSWIDSLPYFSPKLKTKINYIKDNKIDYENKYAVEIYFTELPDFKNELTYKNVDFLNKNLELLTLFKFWNVIEYFCPNKYLFDKKWDSILYKMIPKFIEVSNINDYRRTKKELIACLDDSHSNYFSPFFQKKNKYFPPFEVKIIGSKAVVTEMYSDSLCKKNNIQLGDQIDIINGKTTLEYAKNFWSFVAASNEAIKKREISAILLVGETDSIKNSTSIKLRYTRGDLIINNTIERYSVNKFRNYFNSHVKNKEQKTDTWKFIADDIGYVNLLNIEDDDIKKIFNDFSKTKGIILDIRNYPHLNHNKLCKYIYPKKKRFIYFTKPNFTYPGNFEFEYNSKLHLLHNPFSVGETNKDYYKGKIVVLVDENTQSQAEYMAMALRNAPNAIVVGSQTAGAVVNIVKFSLPDGQEVVYTGYGAFDTEKKNLHRVGIIPDVLVKKTPKDYLGTNYIKKAIEVINESN